jgi:hypothetical protein
MIRAQAQDTERRYRTTVGRRSTWRTERRICGRPATEGRGAHEHRYHEHQRATPFWQLAGLGGFINKRRFEAHTWMRDPEGNDFCVVDT